jgi:hypothetical protein
MDGTPSRVRAAAIRCFASPMRIMRPTTARTARKAAKCSRMQPVAAAGRGLAADAEEPSDLLVGLGVFTLVRDDDSVDWYVFANLKSPSSEDRVRVLAKLDREGVRTDLRASDLMENPHLGLVATGPVDQIKNGVKRFLA